MIALLNPNKERLNVDPYFNRENRFQTNLNFSQKSEDLQKSNLVIDDKFFNLIDEMENFESTKNKINNFNPSRVMKLKKPRNLAHYEKSILTLDSRRK